MSPVLTRSPQRLGEGAGDALHDFAQRDAAGRVCLRVEEDLSVPDTRVRARSR